MQWAYESFAVAWVPDPGSRLAAFGRAFTGWCAESAERCESPAHAAIRRLGAAARGPAGLTAPLLPPFPLRGERELWRLDNALAELAEELEGFLMPRLAVGVVEGTVVLLAAARDERLAAIRKAAARRLGAPRGPAEAAPRPFHLPLSRPLPQHEAERLARALVPLVEDVLAERQRFGDLALMGDAGPERPMRLLDRYRFHRDAERSGPDGLACLGPAMLLPFVPGFRRDRFA